MEVNVSGITTVTNSGHSRMFLYQLIQLNHGFAGDSAYCYQRSEVMDNSLINCGYISCDLQYLFYSDDLTRC